MFHVKHPPVLCLFCAIALQLPGGVAIIAAERLFARSCPPGGQALRFQPVPPGTAQSRGGGTPPAFREPRDFLRDRVRGRTAGGSLLRAAGRPLSPKTHVGVPAPRTQERQVPELGKIIAIVNQKGGVGKTTTCVNLTAALQESGKRVLLCDFDPQANSTSGIGVDKTVSPGVYDALLGSVPSQAAVARTPYGDVLPSNPSLAGAGIELIGMEHREYLLRNALEQLRDAYDYILIDCPPSLELLTLNALCAADSLLVPVQGEYYALEGLSDLMSTVRIVRRSLNPRLELEGVLLTMFDGRTNLAMQVADEVKRYFPGKVYATVIPRNVRLSEAPSHGKPIFAYDRTSRGAEAYRAFAAEFIKKTAVS